MSLLRCPGYFSAYATAMYPPRLCPSRVIFSIPRLILHSSKASTNQLSASLILSSFSFALILNAGRELRPIPSKSKA